MSPEARFSRELSNLRKDSYAAIQFLYTWLTFHHIIVADAHIRRVVNNNAMYWNNTLGALQTSLFIVLGRIFDRDRKNHGVDRLLKEFRTNLDIFSRAALRRRKSIDNPGAQWINNYVQTAYVPNAADVKRISNFVKRKRSIYDTSYAKIRHKVFAHSGTSSQQQVDRLFARTNIGELQKLVLSMRDLHEALWQLFNNGRKPLIGRSKYSVTQLIRSASDDDGHIRSIEESVVASTRQALEELRE